MGARRFSSDSARFLQPDVYGGALSNLGLSMDPLTGNRYALAAGNPVGYVEVDGHTLAKSGTGDIAVTDPGDQAPGSSGRFAAVEARELRDYEQAHRYSDDQARQDIWDDEVLRWYEENNLPPRARQPECINVPRDDVKETLSGCYFHALSAAPSGIRRGRVDPPSDHFVELFAGVTWDELQDEVTRSDIPIKDFVVAATCFAATEGAEIAGKAVGSRIPWVGGVVGAKVADEVVKPFARVLCTANLLHQQSSRE